MKDKDQILLEQIFQETIMSSVANAVAATPAGQAVSTALPAAKPPLNNPPRKLYLPLINRLLKAIQSGSKTGVNLKGIIPSTKSLGV